MNPDNYDIEDQGDGTLILTPKQGTAEDLVARYRELLARIAQAQDFHDRAEAKLVAFGAQQATARDALVAAGIDPDNLP